MSKIKIGVVGVGNIGKLYARELFDGKVAGAELVALCVRDARKIASLQDEFRRHIDDDADGDSCDQIVCKTTAVSKNSTGNGTKNRNTAVIKNGTGDTDHTKDNFDNKIENVAGDTDHTKDNFDNKIENVAGDTSKTKDKPDNKIENVACDTSSDIQNTKILYYSDYDCFIEDSSIDAVLITSPNRFHIEMAEKALHHGKHVLVEKPVGTDIGKVRELIAFAESKNLQYAVMYQNRANPLIQKLKKLLDYKEIGELHRIDWQVLEYYRPQAYYSGTSWDGTFAHDGGGILLNQAIHQLDLLYYLFGMPNRLVARCKFGAYRDVEVETEASLLFDYDTDSDVDSTDDLAIANADSDRDTGVCAGDGSVTAQNLGTDSAIADVNIDMDTSFCLADGYVDGKKFGDIDSATVTSHLDIDNVVNTDMDNLADADANANANADADANANANADADVDANVDLASDSGYTARFFASVDEPFGKNQLRIVGKYGQIIWQDDELIVDTKKPITETYQTPLTDLSNSTDCDTNLENLASTNQSKVPESTNPNPWEFRQNSADRVSHHVYKFEFAENQWDIDRDAIVADFCEVILDCGSSERCSTEFNNRESGRTKLDNHGVCETSTLLSSATDGLKSIEFVQAAYRSERTKSWVQFPLDDF